MSEPPTNKLSVYLIKSEYVDHKDILNENNKLNHLNLEGVGTFYYAHSNFSVPTWKKKFFGESLKLSSEIFNATSKGILLVSVDLISEEKRIFAIPFGFGRTFLNLGVWEERFGLKVVLNTVDPENLRRIDKKNLLHIPKDISEQLSRLGVTADFGIDYEQDLIRSVTGKSKVEGFGNTISGKDALSISDKVDYSNIKEFLITCYKQYVSKDYKDNFGWVDQISDIKDPKVLEKLNLLMIQNIIDKNLDNTWMAVPELVDWADVKGFSYKKNGMDLEDDINLSKFLANLSEDKKNNLDVNFLKRKKVYCFSASLDREIESWKAYNCIYCELQDNDCGKTYLLSNGNWFEIEKNFAQQVNNEYRITLKKAASTVLPVYNHKNENDYNKSVAEQSGKFCCMDRKNIFYGGGKSQVEFCDLFTNDKRIIHVKRYGGSSVLSHLFAQGSVSSELFLTDKNFRSKVNEKLSTSHKFENEEKNPIPSEYQVIFAIISSSNKDLEIPFFSKVSFRNVKRKLEGFGFKVELLKIGNKLE